MTDEKTPQAPEDMQDEQTPVTEETQAPEQEPQKEDGPPEVAGETQAAPLQDPTLLGALTPQENAVLNTLRRRSSQFMSEIGKLEIQKLQLVDQIRANDEQSQSILMQIGRRLGIQDGVSWTVGGDGNARVVPPQLVQAMRGGMPGMAQVPAQQPPAKASQPPVQPEGEKPKEQ